MKEIIKKLYEKQNPSNDFEIQLKQIYDVKRKEIQKTLTTFENRYKKLLEYKNRLDKSDLIAAEREIKKAGETKRFWPKNKGEHLDAIELMLSLDYKPPDNPNQMASHLRSLWVIYTYSFLFIEPLSLLDLHLDIACCKLRVKAESMCAGISKKIRTKKRIKKSDSVKKEKKSEKMQCVLEAYVRMDRTDMSKHSIAVHLEKNVKDKNGNRVANVTTIKRYLEQEGKF